MSPRQSHLCIDSADPAALARWWAELLGWEVTRDDGDEVVVKPAEAPGRWLPLLFLRVADAKTVKNRLHLDLLADDHDADVARALALGASRVDIGQGDVGWTVLADPEGNELCILRPPPDAPTE